MSSISVSTRSYNNQRTGWNYSESVQTPAKIRAHGIRLARQFQMWGDSRGSEGCPLVIPGVTMRDGLEHDLLLCNTMGGDVFCFDHNTLLPLWVQHILNPVPNTLQMDMWFKNYPLYNWSFLPTPAVDTVNLVSWHVGMASPDGSYDKATWYLIGLNLIDGSAVCPPIDLASATYQPPNGLKANTFSNVQRKVRPGLLLDYDRNGVSTLFVSAGSFNEDADTNVGFLIAVDVTKPDQAALACAITTTSRYSGGGNWMSGSAPAMDEDGNVFIVVGNGAFDGATDFGESAVKYTYKPKTATASASLAVAGQCTRFTDTGQVGGTEYQTYADTSLMPPSVVQDDSNPGNTSNMDSKDDMDECSGIALLLRSSTGFSRDVAFYSGKGGIGVLFDAENPPNMALADFAADRIQEYVYGKMLAITGWTNGFGYGTPEAMNITPTDLSTLETTFGGFTHHFHARALYYQSPTMGALIYGGGENGPLRCFKITEPTVGTFELTYVATGTIVASANLANSPPGGMAGCFTCGWSDGANPGTGAIAAVFPYGNVNNSITNGRLVIYAADTFNADGTMQVLWDTEAEAIPFVCNKFLEPTMANGVLTYFTYDSRVLQFT